MVFLVVADCLVEARALDFKTDSGGSDFEKIRVRIIMPSTSEQHHRCETTCRLVSTSFHGILIDAVTSPDLL